MKKRESQRYSTTLFDGIDSKYPPLSNKSHDERPIEWNSHCTCRTTVDRVWYVKYRDFDDKRKAPAESEWTTVSGPKRRGKNKITFDLDMFRSLNRGIVGAVGEIFPCRAETRFVPNFKRSFSLFCARTSCFDYITYIYIYIIHVVLIQKIGLLTEKLNVFFEPIPFLGNIF